MYQILISLFVIVLYFILSFLNKRGFFKQNRLWLRRRSYYHSKVFIQIRFWVKVFTPHMWSASAHRPENWRFFPVFYSLLNGFQMAFVLGGALVLVQANLTSWKISAVEKTDFIEYKATLIDFTESYRDSRGRFEPGRLKVLFASKQEKTFLLNSYFLKDDLENLQQMNRLKGGENIELTYFSVFGIDYLLSLKHNENTYIEKKQSIYAYSDLELGGYLYLDFLTIYNAMIVIGLLIGLLKYKIYGLKNYFNRIKS